MEQRQSQNTPRAKSFFPRRPANIAETRLSPGLISELVLKAIYYERQISGGEIARKLCLPFDTVVRPVLSEMLQEHLIATAGVAKASKLDPLSAYNDSSSFLYQTTDQGRVRAREAIEQCMYCGPAPVALADYINACTQQSIRQTHISPELLTSHLASLVFPQRFVDLLGPAVNSSRSIFLYGNAGNGKSALAEAIGRMLGGDVWIPYCIEVNGQIVRTLDRSAHRISDTPIVDAIWYDPRWVLVRRPVIITAGELTLDSLNLAYDSVAHIHDAPLHMKANNGVFVVDDLGRQQVSTRQLLNRWLYPLERRIDYLTLASGHQFAIPFDVLLIFCTNLDPSDLADEAFYRRIRYKLKVADPTEDEYRAIFKLQCERFHIPFDDDAVNLLFEEYYRPYNRPLRGCHPRDIVEHIVDIARYRSRPPSIAPEMLRQAAQTYFIDCKPACPAAPSNRA